MSLGTVVVVAMLGSAVALALRSIIKGKGKGCSYSSCSACGCASTCHKANEACPAAQKMVEDMEAEASKGADPPVCRCEARR